MRPRNIALIAIAFAVTLAIPSVALAISTSSSSGSSSRSSGSSFSLGSSDVLGALALGAGGRASVDRGAVAVLGTMPFLAEDPCVASVRIRTSSSPYGSSLFGSSLFGSSPLGSSLFGSSRFGSSYVGSSYDGPSYHGSSSIRSHVQASISTARLSDSMQSRLAGMLIDTNGTLTQEALVQEFRGQRDQLLIVDCAHPAARHLSSVLLGPCIERGRGCTLALAVRVSLDANGIDETERALVTAAMRR